MSRHFLLTARFAAGAGFRLFLTAALMLLNGPVARAQSAESDTAVQREQSVAQTVFAIMSYVRWPVQPPKVRLCVIGPTQYADQLLQAPSPAQAMDRKVVSRRLDVDNGSLSSTCDVIYTGALDAGVERNLYARLAGHAVLSISEADSQCIAGPMFCLAVTDQRVSFKVNLDSVARSGLRVHPSVLQLGRAKAAGQ